jgi:outer membrane protein assembly factor BamB
MNKQPPRQTWPATTLALIVALMPCTIALRAAGETPRAGEILEQTGVDGGLVVHLGCGDGRLTAALRANDRLVVHGLDRDAANVQRARKHLQSQGLCGPVSVDLLQGERLPYIDNLASLVVAEDLGDVSEAEVMRVLAPFGVAYVKADGKWTKKSKAWPGEIDQWTHYLHGPDNNAVANDSVVAPPKGLQWVAGPLWSRAHSTLNGTSCMVSARNRIFTIEDLAPIELPLMPGKYTLVARDAFNGVVLWKRALENWENITHWMKPNPVQPTRRLVADGDRVYATLGIDAPVTALDAATGEILTVYEGTERTQEILYADGVLYVVTGDPMNPYGTKPGSSYYRPNYAVFGEDRYAPLRPPKEKTQFAIAAVDASTGEMLWRKSGSDAAGYQATTLAVRGDRLTFHTASDLIYADRADGRVIWQKPCPVSMRSKTQHPGGASPTLVLQDDAVLRADAEQLVVFSTRDGSELWRTPTSLTYHSSPDIFVVGNTVWPYPSTDGHDLATGKVVATRRETRDKPMGHDRCYRNKATVNYMINSRSGGADFSKLGDDWSRAHPWVRGTCSLGIMPCNGLLYASPHACSCVNETKLYGFYALKGQGCDERPANVLVKGPAYGRDRVPKAQTPTPADWPTYRQNAARSGTAETTLTADLRPLWKAKITDATAPVVAAGRVLVASKDTHTLHSLDAADGAILWSFTAGGRIDSPPTCAGPRVLFGSADGWVYCLKADSGELAWKFRAAPQDRRTVAFGQVESLWPVHGSVLVLDETVYFAAGRQSFLDGGLYLYGLDLQTGRKKHTARISGPYGEDGESVFDTGGRQIKGNKSDLLVSGGELIYLRHMAFNPDLTPAAEGKEHVVTVSGFLDRAGHHRSYWTVAPRLIYDTAIADNIDADLLVTDGPHVFGTRISASNRGPEAFDARKRGIILFAVTHDRDRAAAQRQRRLAAAKKTKVATRAAQRRISSLARSRSPFVTDWQIGVPVNGKAMIKSGDALFVAGTPNEFPDDDLYRAVEGRAGGILALFSTADGKTLKTHRLESPPVWDGMAAAGDRLFVSLTSGHLQCWAPRGRARGDE